MRGEHGATEDYPHAGRKDALDTDPADEVTAGALLVIGAGPAGSPTAACLPVNLTHVNISAPRLPIGPERPISVLSPRDDDLRGREPISSQGKSLVQEAASG